MNKFRVTASSLYIRKEPNLNGLILGALQMNDTVDYISKSGDGYWYKIVRDDGLTGWSSHKYLISLENDGQIGWEEFPWMPFAIREIGLKEYAGAADNPRIIEYHSSTTLKAPHRLNDETSWCSSFVNWCVEKSGFAGTDSAWARSWLHWGKKINNPRRGCLVVFKRPCNNHDEQKTCGHIAFFISETDSHVKVLGGNQANRVGYKEYHKGDVLSYRIP